MGVTSKRPAAVGAAAEHEARHAHAWRRPKPSTRGEVDVGPQLDEAAEPERGIGEVRRRGSRR